MLETQSYIPRLKKEYNTIIIPKLFKHFQYSNIMEVPKLIKIVVSISDKNMVTSSSLPDKIESELMSITGQKPIKIKAKKSIAGFKLREGSIIGLKVTLRKNIMYEFLDKLIYVAFPRIRDFRGFSSRQLTANGSFSIGLKEQLIFPEVNYNDIDGIRGMNITFVTNAKSKESLKELMKMFNFPFSE